MSRSKSAIMTCSGRWIDPFNPDPNQVHIGDLAHHLANQCRFTGATKFFYSVAQHSCLVSDQLPPELKLHGLMHDASEAYLSDIASPVKKHDDCQFYRQIESGIQEVIYEKYGLPPCTLYGVTYVDQRMLATEAEQLMPPNWQVDYSDPSVEYKPFPIKIKTWTHARAKKEFMERFLALYLGEYGPLLHSELVS